MIKNIFTLGLSFPDSCSGKVGSSIRESEWAEFPIVSSESLSSESYNAS